MGGVKSDTAQYHYEVVIAAIVKNEGSYIEEWIAYHRLIGVDKFVIYDNESSDNLYEILVPYVEKGQVEYIAYPGQLMQTKAYTDAIERYRHETRYLGFIDIDEFIVVHDGMSLPEMLNEHFNRFPKAGGIAMQWYNFGTSGHKKKPEGLVMENYTMRASVEFRPLVKTIGNPRLMECCVNPHFPIYKLGVYNKNEAGKTVLGVHLYNYVPSKVHINHYFTKSEEECLAKFTKGRADVKEKYGKEYLEFTNRNDIYDGGLLRYVAQVKALMMETGRMLI